MKQSDTNTQLSDFISAHQELSGAQRTVLFMTQIGFTLKDLEALSLGVALPLCEAIYQCREKPPSYWPEEAYVLMKRQDLSAQARLLKEKKRRFAVSIGTTRDILFTLFHRTQEYTEYTVLNKYRCKGNFSRQLGDNQLQCLLQDHFDSSRDIR